MIAEFLSIHFLFFSLLFSGSVVLLSAHHLRRSSFVRAQEWTLLALVHAWATVSTVWISDEYIALPYLIVVAACSVMAIRQIAPHYSLSGRFFMAANAGLTISGFIWSVWFIFAIPVGDTTRMLMLLAIPLVFLALPTSAVQFLEKFEVLCRARWVRPRTVSKSLHSRSRYPKVSLHVPTYAEPPEIVIETLNHIARIDYPNLEVLVIDNNTKDPALWQPVQRHITRLGKPFRFFHVEDLAGAKAGALNYALQRTATDAEIVGVIDADYHARPDFLRALTGYFDNPRMGFVQTPHDYRDWEHNPYLRMCYFEYNIFFRTTMVSMNERDAALTVGTMCLIRRSALEEVGGWATWCVTEDSELSIRLHAAGYTSVYLTESYGKGLIPDTFLGYRKQRYRWTAGPVQEFKKHFALLVPFFSRIPAAYTLGQRMHHFNHGLSGAITGLSLLLVPLGAFIAISMAYHREIIRVPFELWVGATVLFVSGWMLDLLLYRVAAKTSIQDSLGALIANKALSHVTSLAAFRTLLHSRVPWYRTDKFKTDSTLMRALIATKTEVVIGLTLIVIVLSVFVSTPMHGLLLMLLIGLSYHALGYLSAPLVALIAEWSMNGRYAHRTARLAPFGVSAAYSVLLAASVGYYSLISDTTVEYRHIPTPPPKAINMHLEFDEEFQDYALLRDTFDAV